MDEQQTYEIEDGARRAKAAWLSGHEMMEAQVANGPTFLVPISSLRLPHTDSIDVSGPGGMRWARVLRATEAGVPLPPIEVLPGVRGKTIQEVSVPSNELDLFR